MIQKYGALEQFFRLVTKIIFPLALIQILFAVIQTCILTKGAYEIERGI